MCIKRIISAIIGIIILYFIINILPDFFFILSLFLFSLIANWEFLNTTNRKIHKRLLILVNLWTIIIFILAYIYKTPTFFSYLLIFSFISFMVINISLFKYISFDKVTLYFFSIIYIPFFISYLLYIKYLDNGLLLIWYSLITVWSCDTAAYFIGTYFGRKKLCPEISPKKSVEGFVAGNIASVIISYIFIVFFIEEYKFIPFGVIILIGIIMGIISQIGVLTASIIKRNYKIKDYGSIIPGHGGILDRLDSILITIPVFYYLFLYIDKIKVI